MIRTTYILLLAIASAFFSENVAAESIEKTIIVSAEVTESNTESESVSFSQDNSPYQFVYWDERVRTTLSGVHEHNRFSRFNTVLRHSPLISKCYTDSERSGFSYAEYHRATIDYFIVALRKIRI